MIDHVVLAMRASPDWASFAREHAAGGWVDPVRYLPAANKNFPTHIVTMIERWNAISPVSYFACRQAIRDISAANLASVENATLIKAEDAANFISESTRHYNAPVVFFHDDDDWFHPNLLHILSRQLAPAADAHVLVFPFFRLASNMVTFTRDGQGVAGAIGRCEPFRYRYCTNNYGLTRRALADAPQGLVEHVDASRHGEAAGFADAHCDVVVSATSKTPCSASWLHQLPATEDGFRTYVRTYVMALRAVDIPDTHDWMRPALQETIALFERVSA